MPGPGPYGNKKPASQTTGKNWAGKASKLAEIIAKKRLEVPPKKIAFRKSR